MNNNNANSIALPAVVKLPSPSDYDEATEYNRSKHYIIDGGPSVGPLRVRAYHARGTNESMQKVC